MLSFLNQTTAVVLMVVCKWQVELSDGRHEVVFHHGTTSGQRILTVDGKEIRRQNWMFKLVGAEDFYIGTTDKHACRIMIEAAAMAYVYSLFVDGRPLSQFTEQREKTTQQWHFEVDGDMHLVVLEKETMMIWADGTRVESQGEFAEDGTETSFTIGGHEAYVLTTTQGGKRGKILHELFVDDMEIPLNQEARQ
eukprot:m.283010 g.283010  ORF g.283010 m.283010 type:complete len:194 (-) comp19410_c0_seq1:66-647(-)